MDYYCAVEPVEERVHIAGNYATILSHCIAIIITELLTAEIPKSLEYVSGPSRGQGTASPKLFSTPD